MKDDGLREALEIFGKEYIAELSELLRKEDKVASGDLIKSLDSRVIKTAMGTLYTIQLSSEKYLKYVDGGRGRMKGYPPPIKAIKEWCRFKGINEDYAWGIRHNIWKNGIKPTNVISKTLKKVQNGMGFRKFEDGASDWVDNLVEDLMLDISKNNNITVRR